MSSPALVITVSAPEIEQHVDEWVSADVRADFTCAICADVLREPVNLSTCSDTFCLRCLREYVEHSVAHPNCPVCAVPLASDIKSLLSAAACINGRCSEQLRKLKVSCPHCHVWQSTLGSTRVHIDAHRSECGEFPLPCSVGCGVSIARSQLAEHEREKCPKRLVVCDRCGGQFASKQLASHHIGERECERAHLCERGCGMVVLDSNWFGHMHEDCKLQGEFSQLDTQLPNTVGDVSAPIKDDAVYRSQLAAKEDEILVLRRRLSVVTLSLNLVSDAQTAIQWVSEQRRHTPESMKTLVMLLRTYRESSQVQAACCQSLFDQTVALGRVTQLQPFIQAGGTNCVTSAMSQHRSVASLQEAACGVLWKLSVGDSASTSRAHIMTAGGVDCAVAALKQHPHLANVQLYGCKLLANLACDPDAKLPLSTNGGLACVVSAMKQHTSADILGTGCRALQNLSWKCDETLCERIIMAGGVECVVSAMMQHGSNQIIQQEGAGTLWRLATQPSALPLIAAAGGIQCLVLAMKQHLPDAAVQRAACRALFSLTADKRLRDRVVSAGGIECIVAAMDQHPEAADMRRTGRTALSRLAERPDNRGRIIKAGGKEGAAFYGKKEKPRWGLRRLLQLLSSNKP